MKSKRSLLVLSSILVLLTCIFLFFHSTPQRAVRGDLLINGHIIDTFKTEVFFNGSDPQYGDRYSCKKPAVGADFYFVNKKSIANINYWYITNKGGA